MLVDASHAAGSQMELLIEEVANGSRNFGAVGPQCKVARFEKADISAWNVTLERFGSCWQKERVVLPPHA